MYPGVRTGRPGPSAGGEAGCTRGSGQGGQVYPGGLECGQGGQVGHQVYPLTRQRLEEIKKKETGKKGNGEQRKKKKNRPGAGPLRHATRGHLLPARPAEEGGGGPGQTPRPRSARGTQGRGRARARRPAPLLRQQARSGTAPPGAPAAAAAARTDRRPAAAAAGERQKLVSRADSQ